MIELADGTAETKAGLADGFTTRLYAAMKHAMMSEQRLADNLLRSVGHVKAVVTGRRKPGSAMLDALAITLDVPRRWLETGEAVTSRGYRWELPTPHIAQLRDALTCYRLSKVVRAVRNDYIIQCLLALLEQLRTYGVDDHDTQLIFNGAAAEHHHRAERARRATQ